jgi:hypothetical protein
MSAIEQGDYFSKVRRYMRTHKNLTGAEHYAHFLQLWQKSNDCSNCSKIVDCDEYRKLVNAQITGISLLKSGSSSRVTEIDFMVDENCVVVLDRYGIFCHCAEGSQ